MMIKTLHRYFSVKKKIYSPQNSKEIILDITKRISHVVGITLGPKGRNVMIQNEIRQQPRITKDGVTVLKNLQFVQYLQNLQENPYQNAVATLMKNSVEGTNKFAGDGTTSSTIMIGQIVRCALKKLMIGVNTSRQIREGLKIARQISLDYLQAVKRQITSQQDLYNIAMISTNGDTKIAKIISEAIWKSSAVSVQKSNTKETYIQYFSGLKIVRGVPNAQFKNFGDKIIYNYPLVVTSKVPLQSTRQIVKVLQMAKKARKQLMIFSEKVNQNIISTMVYNKRKNVVQSCAMQLPVYGQMAKKYIQMISESTGSFVFDKFTKPIEQIEWEDFGKAVKITVDEFETQIRGKKKQNELVSAIIYAGGSTEAVAMQKYDKIIDALNSVSTSKKKGIVAGAGLTYWNLAELLDQYEGDYQVGVKVLAQALRGPRRRLYQTVQPQNKPFESKGWTGFNLKTNKMQDMFDAGIIDSVQVCRNVIIDSISLASQLIQIQIGVIRAEESSKLMDWKQIRQKYTL